MLLVLLCRQEEMQKFKRFETKVDEFVAARLRSQCQEEERLQQLTQDSRAPESSSSSDNADQQVSQVPQNGTSGKPTDIKVWR
jgi:hypothetical protein